jgi:hypothetical protein
MIDMGAAAGIASVGEAPVQSAQERAMRGTWILKRLAAGWPLAEIAAEDGLSPGEARELMAEAVALRGFDP